MTIQRTPTLVLAPPTYTKDYIDQNNRAITSFLYKYVVANSLFDQTAYPMVGQIQIGTGTGYKLGTLTAGNNTTIVNALGSITINAGTLLATQAMTSGTTKDFIIPANVVQFTVTLAGVSTSGTDNIIGQLGTSGGIANTGYLGLGGTGGVSSAGTQYTTGIGIPVNLATAVLHGSITFTLVEASTFTWVGVGTFSTSNANNFIVTTTTKVLTSALTTFRWTTLLGTATFTAGKSNVKY